MPGKAAKVRLSEKQLDVLRELSRSRTEPKCVVQRASIMVFAFEGRWNQEIATSGGTPSAAGGNVAAAVS